MSKSIIRTKPGDTVRYMSCNARSSYDQVIAAQYLHHNREYTAIDVCVNNTTMYGANPGLIRFEEFPDQWFSMSLFELVDSDDLDDSIMIKNDCTGGWINLRDATPKQLRAEVRGMHKMIEKVKTMTGDINTYIENWENS